MSEKLDKIIADYTALPNKNKPLKLAHGYPYAHGATISQKQNAIKAKLAEFAAIGYGGVVTNVSFNNYLRDDEEWQLFRFTLQTCAEMELRVWIYDERGYPSGSAGGETLEGHPERQAQAAVIKTATAMPGQPIKIEFPHGHLDVIAAYAYKAESLDVISDADINNPARVYNLRGTQNGIDDINDTDSPLTAVLFVRKYMYEGTHAQHNVCESRRYIDVSNREAVAAFIENTYKKYAFYSKDCAQVEAFFTDEPSYMGAYINLGAFPAVKDEYDESMELLPCVNWGADLENRFPAKLGYDLPSRMTYLFCGHTRLAKLTRLDFYETMSELYENAFFEQLSDYCAKVGIPFSGHILLEDDIRYHPVFEGNFFSLLRHMHIPGIDMLNGTPERTRSDAFTPKLVSSVAHTYNRPHVMSEISAHVQGGNVTYEQMLCTVLTQYALGADTFTSYFGESALDTEKYNRWNDTIGRVDAIMGGGSHIADIAVYYPIETMQANYIPSKEEIYRSLGDSSEMNACWSSLRGIYNNLLCSQLDFDFLDMYAMERASIANMQINTTGNEHFHFLVMPACYLSDEMEVVVRHLCYKGVTVVAVYDEEFASDCARLRECGASIIYGVDQLSAMIKEARRPAVSLSVYTPDALALCRENANGRSALIVNTADVEAEATAVLSGFSDTVTLFDPEENRVLGEYPSNSVPVKLAAYKAVMITDN